MKALLICLFCLFGFSAFASDQLFADPAQEARAHEIFAQLRCVVCAGQSLNGSNAKLAVEMRNLIREKMRDGESDDSIIHYFSERYGDDILMNPPIEHSTYILWFAPLIFLLIAFFMGARLMRS